MPNSGRPVLPPLIAFVQYTPAKARGPSKVDRRHGSDHDAGTRGRRKTAYRHALQGASRGAEAGPTGGRSPAGFTAIEETRVAARQIETRLREKNVIVIMEGRDKRKAGHHLARDAVVVYLDRYAD